MKAYIHGVRAGQTIKLGRVKFIRGVANVIAITDTLARYDIKNYAPEVEKEDEEVTSQDMPVVILEADKEESEEADKEESEEADKEESEEADKEESEEADKEDLKMRITSTLKKNLLL